MEGMGGGGWGACEYLREKIKGFILSRGENVSNAFLAVVHGAETGVVDVAT